MGGAEANVVGGMAAAEEWELGGEGEVGVEATERVRGVVVGGDGMRLMGSGMRRKGGGDGSWGGGDGRRGVGWRDGGDSGCAERGLGRRSGGRGSGRRWGGWGNELVLGGLTLGLLVLVLFGDVVKVVVELARARAGRGGGEGEGEYAGDGSGTGCAASPRRVLARHGVQWWWCWLCGVCVWCCRLNMEVAHDAAEARRWRRKAMECGRWEVGGSDIGEEKAAEDTEVDGG